MKKTQLDKAIAELEAEKAVIQHAIDKLKALQAQKPRVVRKPRQLVGSA